MYTLPVSVDIAISPSAKFLAREESIVFTVNAEFAQLAEVAELVHTSLSKILLIASSISDFVYVEHADNAFESDNEYEPRIKIRTCYFITLLLHLEPPQSVQPEYWKIP